MSGADVPERAGQVPLVQTNLLLEFAQGGPDEGAVTRLDPSPGNAT